MPNPDGTRTPEEIAAQRKNLEQTFATGHDYGEDIKNAAGSLFQMLGLGKGPREVKAAPTLVPSSRPKYTE